MPFAVPVHLQLHGAAVQCAQGAGQIGQHGLGIGVFVLAPLQSIHRDRLGLAPDGQGTQAHEAGARGIRAALGGLGILHRAGAEPDFARPRTLAQARCQVHGVAVAIAIDLHDLSARHAHAHLQAHLARPFAQVLLVVAHQRRHGLHGTRRSVEGGQHAVPQGLNHAPALAFNRLAEPMHHMGHGFSGARIAQNLVQGSASRDISKHDHRRAAHGFLLRQCMLQV